MRKRPSIRSAVFPGGTAKSVKGRAAESCNLQTARKKISKPGLHSLTLVIRDAPFTRSSTASARRFSRPRSLLVEPPSIIIERVPVSFRGPMKYLFRRVQEFFGGFLDDGSINGPQMHGISRPHASINRPGWRRRKKRKPNEFILDTRNAMRVPQVIARR